MEIIDKLNYISSYFSKVLRKKFGRGPQSCQATMSSNYLVIYIRGFISPMEEVLLSQGQRKYVENAREVIIDHILDELNGVIQVTLEVEIEDFYHDWNFPNNSGLIMLVLEKEVIELECKTDIDIGSFEVEVARISALVQKVPDAIKTIPISRDIVLVERVGILVPIEKALISKGFITELKITKDELEKSYFHKDRRFDGIFDQPLRDIFIDWNMKDDKSLMGFVLK